MINVKRLELDLWFNNITDKGLTTLSKSLTHLHQLEHLHLNLRSNPLHELDITNLLTELNTLTDLKRIDLNLQQTKIKDYKLITQTQAQPSNLNII